MKIALPVAKNDIAQFKKRNDLLIKFGGLVDHSALIVYASSVRNEAISECERLSTDRKSTRLNSSHSQQSRMPSSA